MNEFRYSPQRENHENVPSDFYMGTIAKTISLIVSRIPTNVYNRSHTVRHITDISDPYSTSDTFNEFPDTNDNTSELDSADVLSIIHALQGHSSTSNKCALCNTDGHTTIDCFKFIDYNLCNQLQKTNPTLAAKILAKHHFSPGFRRGRSSPSSNRSSTPSNTRTSPPSTLRLVNDQFVPNDTLATITEDSNDSVVHCLNANVPHFDSYLHADPLLFCPDINTQIDNTIHSIHVDLPMNEYSAVLEDSRTINTVGITDHSFPEDPIHQGFTERLHCCFDDTVPQELIDPSAPQVREGIFAAQIDSGANTNTTNHASLLWNVHKLDHPKRMQDAGQTEHLSKYRGYLVLQDTDHSYKAVATYYTPSIHATIISPDAICKQYSAVKTCNFNFDVDTHEGKLQFCNRSNVSLFSPQVSHT